MAKCSVCNLEMSGEAPAKSCKAVESDPTIGYPNDSKKYDLIPFAHPEDLMGGGEDVARCHDCNVAKDGYHHPGCDAERCPKCRGQLISCGCLEK